VKMSFYKRFFDVIVSFTVLVISLPGLFFLAFTVFFFIGRPIFFIQIRPGMGGRPFRMIKFRTMIDCKEAKLLSDADRLNRYGRFLRLTSLDELPQFWCVLKGDMSLVGPRPLLLSYLPLYSPDQARRHLVRPGITGWAQVNGRNAISWEEKFQLDVWYVDNQSFFLDVKILMLTILRVFQMRGISQRGEVTMSEFRGNHK
jgi:sugar transferase EpsL